MMDYGIIDKPVIVGPRMQFDIRGLFFKKFGQEEFPTVDPPSLPYIDDTNPPAALQAFVSDVTFNSLAAAFV